MDQAVLGGDSKQAQKLIRNGADVHGPYGDSPLLHLAIKKGYVNIALAVLAAGADVHAKDAGGWTALRWACLVGKENVQALIDKGSQVDERNHLGETPIMEQRRVPDISLCLLRAGASCEGLEQERVGELLHYAWNKRDLLAIRCLFKDSSRVSILSTDEQEGLLHHACREGDVFVVRTLLKNGCRVSILSADEQEGLLHHACRQGDVFVVHTLLENGCRVSILSREEQEKLFHLACREHDVFVVHTLIQNSCSVKKLTREDLLYCVHILSKQKIEELLHLACCEDDAFVVCTLLENGCHVSMLSREKQEKLFHLACRESDVFVVRTLIQYGCSVKKLTREDLLYCVHILSKQKIEELLHLACHEGNVFVVRTLLENGCHVSILSREEQEKLFHLACREGNVFVVRTLLENGCRVSILSRVEQEELFHLACREGDMFIVRTLLENGCRVSILSTDEQEGLLHHACSESDVFVVRTLLENGCCVSILSADEQEGLLHHACSESDVFVVRTLIQYGCSVKKLTREDLLYCVHISSKQKIEELLHLACRDGNVVVVRTLLENGCRVSILSREEQEKLFHLACRDGDAFVARTLLKNGCRVSILSREEQEKLFHHACCERHAFVVRTLLQYGYSVKKLTREDLLYCVRILSKQEIEDLFHQACSERDVFVVRTLLENGCRVSILSAVEQGGLLHLACHERDVFVVHTLLENGCRVSILSAVEQEVLLHLACRESDVFVVRTLIRNGCSVKQLTQENLLYCVRILSKQEIEKILHLVCRDGNVFFAHILLENGCQAEGKRLLCLACLEGDAFVVETLLASSCDVNCADSAGLTPLMYATMCNHEEVAKKLILAGADLGIQCANSNTALHLAATHNSIQCGILLAEGGASVRTKNNLAKTSLDLASAEFKTAIKEALSFTTRKALCIIGNAESGKSTLIAALQAESNSFLGKIINRFRRVSDRRQRTAGIETVCHCSRRYGEVLFFDFAGQDDYHGPHEMFLESLLSKPGVSMTLLLVVKMTEEEDAILHQLHRWLTPVALMATSDSPPQVIIIGSFLDKVKSHQEEATAKLTRCIEATRRDLVELSLEIVGTSFLNCRQPQSQGIDQICKFLQEIPIPEFRATHSRYSLAWVLSQIRSSFKAQAVQLMDFSKWVQDNKDNLPQTMPTPEEVCQDLSAAGHALYLPNRADPPKSWLVLDLPSILHDVYGTLFSQSKAIVNEFGLLQCRHLAELFPNLDLEMVQQLLISLEFCLPVDPSVLKELSKLTQSKEDIGWLFFPALISAKPPQTTVEGLPQQSGCYFCWQLWTAEKHSISARLLQTILLRLAAHFVVKQPNKVGVQQHCCSIWWNGIEWQSTKGIDVTVHIIGNRVIQVMGASVASADTSCQYLTDVISDILSTVHRLSPKLEAGAYIVHSPKILMSPKDIIAQPAKELFSVEGIQNSIKDGYCLSLKDSNTNRSTRAVISDLFGGCTPSLEDIGRINWPCAQLDPSLPQSPCGTSRPSQPQSPCGTSWPSPPQSPCGTSQLDAMSQKVYSEYTYSVACLLYNYYL